ncbi:MAG: glycosyltransferase family 2 protein [Deltaproteobacteria bacterium]|nr:glycosyltransferase family 2 protein [Deltaproteobacteria bacterium]
MKIAVVVPVFNEQENLRELYRRLRGVFEKLQDITWQVVYVNDGSNDSSIEIMLEQCREDPRFSVIDLSRNFGHQAAISAGLAHASADAVILMDADLQDPPQIIPELVEHWRQGAEVVRAERRTRKEKGLRRLGFETFHRVFTWISDFPIPSQSGIFGLLDIKAVQELNRLPEKNRYLPGLRSWVGFRQEVIYYDREDRAAGEPKQTLRRLIRYALDAIFSFSYKPLRLMTGIGACISIGGFVLACVFVVKRLWGIETAQTGFTTLITMILFLGGVQLVAIGLVGEYMARIYDEVKQRPLYIVSKLYGIEPPNRSGSAPSSCSAPRKNQSGTAASA